MTKPKPVTEVRVLFHYEPTRTIGFAATPDMIEDFREFGHIYNHITRYELTVSGHYDFQEVLTYIESKEKQSK